MLGSERLPSFVAFTTMEAIAAMMSRIMMKPEDLRPVQLFASDFSLGLCFQI